MDKVNVLRAILRDLPDETATLRHEVEREWSASQYEKVYVRILDQTGKLVMESPGMANLVPPDAFPERISQEPELVAGDMRSSSGLAFRVLLSRAPVGPSKGGPWLIQAALNRDREEDLLAEYRKRLWVILPAALVACTLVGYWIARFGIRPIHRMDEKARTIGSETLHERIESSRFPSELSALAATFNEMLDRWRVPSIGSRGSPPTSPTSCGRPSTTSGGKSKWPWVGNAPPRSTRKSSVRAWRSAHDSPASSTASSSWPMRRARKPRSERSAWT